MTAPLFFPSPQPVLWVYGLEPRYRGDPSLKRQERRAQRWWQPWRETLTWGGCWSDVGEHETTPFAQRPVGGELYLQLQRRDVLLVANIAGSRPFQHSRDAEDTYQALKRRGVFLACWEHPQLDSRVARGRKYLHLLFRVLADARRVRGKRLAKCRAPHRVGKPLFGWREDSPYYPARWIPDLPMRELAYRVADKLLSQQFEFAPEQTRDLYLEVAVRNFVVRKHTSQRIAQEDALRRWLRAYRRQFPWHADPRQPRVPHWMLDLGIKVDWEPAQNPHQAPRVAYFHAHGGRIPDHAWPSLAAAHFQQYGKDCPTHVLEPHRRDP